MVLIVLIACVVVWLAAKLARNVRLRVLGFFAGWAGAVIVAGIVVPLSAVYVEELAGQFDKERMARALGQCIAVAVFFFPLFYWMLVRRGGQSTSGQD